MRHIKTVSKQIWIAAVIIMTLILGAACTAGTGSEPAADSGDESVTISGQVWQWLAFQDSATYVSLLGDVVTFMFDGEGNLVLNLKADAGNMIFAPAQ